jgi:hypothetical protein
METSDATIQPLGRNNQEPGGMSVRSQLAWGARYTKQALFGGYDNRTGEYFTGAFDLDGNLANPDLMPIMLSPELAHTMGMTEEQRVMMGYNPDYPYELRDVTSSGSAPRPGTQYANRRGYSRASSPGRYARGGVAGSPLVNWRIGL